MLIRIEQSKGRKGRNAMLSPQLLSLLRLWWQEGKRRSVMLPHGWLFPGRSATDPISTRQINCAIPFSCWRHSATVIVRSGDHVIGHRTWSSH
jgi:integrase